MQSFAIGSSYVLSLCYVISFLLNIIWSNEHVIHVGE